MDEMQAYSGRSVHEEIMQKLLSTVHANESHLASMADPISADSTLDAEIDRRKVALDNGFSELVSLDSLDLSSGLTRGDTALAPAPVKISLTVPEKVRQILGGIKVHSAIRPH